MVVFSLAGSVFGMAEEVIPFVVIFIPLARRLGYDSIVGVSIPFLGAAAGFAAAFFNPFTVGIAQSIAGLPLYSGLGYRLVTWVVGTAVIDRLRDVVRAAGEAATRRSARCATSTSSARRSAHTTTPPSGWDARHVVTLALFVASMVLLVVGVLQWKWYIDQIAVLFFGMGIVLGFAGGLGPEPRGAHVRRRRQGHGRRRLHRRLRAGAAGHRAGRQDPRHDALCGLGHALGAAAGRHRRR